MITYCLGAHLNVDDSLSEFLFHVFDVHVFSDDRDFHIDRLVVPIAATRGRDDHTSRC